MVAYAGQIAASLASLSRTVDDYSALSKKELIPAKQEKAFERVKNFRAELGDYRQQFDGLRKAREDAVSHFSIYLATIAHNNSNLCRTATSSSAVDRIMLRLRKTPTHNLPSLNHRHLPLRLRRDPD